AAMVTLALLYANGHGVTQDYAKARVWYENAVAKGNTGAMDSLKRLLIVEAAAAGRYAKALQLQESLAVEVEAVETKREGKPGEETAEGLLPVAWYALFAREFRETLVVAGRAAARLPDNLLIGTHRAPAPLVP